MAYHRPGKAFLESQESEHLRLPLGEAVSAQFRGEVNPLRWQRVGWFGRSRQHS